jgi:hypothetical protein
LPLAIGLAITLEAIIGSADANELRRSRARKAVCGWRVLLLEPRGGDVFARQISGCGDGLEIAAQLTAKTQRANVVL